MNVSIIDQVYNAGAEFAQKGILTIDVINDFHTEHFADSSTHDYPFGIIKPEVTSLTYDSDDRLIKPCQSFPDENIIDIRQ